MILIHKTLDLLPVLNYIRLLLVLLPIVTAIESDSQDFYISSDQLLQYEPQIIIENDNDQLLQETFDPSKLDELNSEDNGDLESSQSIVNQNSINDSLDLISEEDTSDYSSTADDNSTMQKLPKSSTSLIENSEPLLLPKTYQYYQSTLEELPNRYKDQPVKLDLQSIPAQQYIQKELSQQHQYTEVNNDEAVFNQVHLNQQKILDQANNNKLPELPMDPNTYWDFPSVNYPLHVDHYLSDPSFIGDYFSSYDDLSNLDDNVQHKKDPNNHWMNANEGHNVFNDYPNDSTVEQLSVVPSNKLNPLRSWFDQNSNYLTPNMIPHLQHYQYADSEIYERHKLPPNRYQHSYQSGTQFTGNEPNIYKPLDSETYSELSQNKNSIPEPLNGIPLLKQYSNDEILRPTFEQHLDAIAPEVVVDYNQGDIYQNLPKDLGSEIEPLYNVPLGHGFETEVAYYDPVDVDSELQPAHYAPIGEPKAVSPLSEGLSSKPHAAYNVQIDQGSNYQKAVGHLYDVPIEYIPLVQGTETQASVDSQHNDPRDQSRKTQTDSDNPHNDLLNKSSEPQSPGDYLHHIPIDQGGMIVTADDSTHNYPIDQVKETLVESNDSHIYPIVQNSIPHVVGDITHDDPLEEERNPQATSNDSQIALKDPTIKPHAVEEIILTDPINQESKFQTTRVIPHSDSKDRVSEPQTVDDLTPYDTTDQKIKPHHTGELHNDPNDQEIQPHGSSDYTNNVPLSDNLHNVIIQQSGESRTFDNHSYNIPIEQVNRSLIAYNKQQSSLNQNNLSFISENSINKIMNEPWAWFSEHPGVEKMRQTLHSDTYLAVDNQNNIDEVVQVPIDQTRKPDAEIMYKKSDMEGTQQSLFDNVDINYSHTPSIIPVKFDKDIKGPDDKVIGWEFTQEDDNQFSKDKSSSFESNEPIDEENYAVTPSLLLNRIFNEILHQVEENEQDDDSRKSPLLDYSKDVNPPIISDIDATYVFQKILADQIRMWNNPEIYIDQPLNSGRQIRIDQIRNDPPQLSLNHDINMDITMYQDSMMDLAIDDIFNQVHSESVSDINPPLIPIDLSDGIRQSAGNPTDFNGPYLAVDYDSPVRYSTFWNPLDMPFASSDYYIIFDLKNIFTVTKMYIRNFGDKVHDITAFNLEVWDGYGKWRMISNFFCQAGIGAHQEFGGFIGTGRYWKFTATKTASGFQPWLVELGLQGLEDYGEYFDYLDDTSSKKPTEPDNFSESNKKALSDTMEAKPNRDGPLHIPTWIYYLVGLVVLALAMLSMTCLVMHMAKKRNGLYNITLVMGKGKEDSVTPIVSYPSKDYTASAPPALLPTSAPEAELDSNLGVYQVYKIQTSIQ